MDLNDAVLEYKEIIEELIKEIERCVYFVLFCGWFFCFIDGVRDGERSFF